MCIAVFFTVDARVLVRSQYSEGPATGHLDTGFRGSEASEVNMHQATFSTITHKERSVDGQQH
jgi:hypothetical protein